MSWLRNMKYKYSLRTLILRPGRSYVSCKLHLAFLSLNVESDQAYLVVLTGDNIPHIYSELQ